MQKGFNTLDRTFLETGKLKTDDVPPEVLYYFSEACRLAPHAERLGDCFFPFPLPEFLDPVEVRGKNLRFEDSVNIRIPDEFVDVGDIPEIEYSDDPFLQTGPLSTRRYTRMKEEVEKIYKDFGAEDKTTGITPPLQEMNIPEQVKQDPLGADFTGQMGPVDE